MLRRFVSVTTFLWFVTSIGHTLTDEQRQLLAFHNLRRGHLDVAHDVPAYFGIFQGLEYGRYANEIGGARFVAHSPLVNFLSLPAYFILDLVDKVVPLALLLAILWAGGAYWSIRWGVDWAGRLRSRPVQWYARPAAVGLDPARAFFDRLQRMTPPHRWLVAGLAALTAWQAVVVPRFDYGLWGEAMAIQLTTILVCAAAVVAFHALLLMFLPRWSAHVGAWLLLTATPLAFWGTQIKYHGVMMALVIFSMYFYTRGIRASSWKLRGIAIACGGLAVWNHLSGVFLVVGLGVAELVHAPWPRSWRWDAWRPRVNSHGIAVIALVIGLLPWLVYNNEVFGNPLTDAYFASPDTGGLDAAIAEGDDATVDAKLEATQQRFDARAEHQFDGEKWGGRWSNSLQVFFWGQGVEGTALAVFTLTPVLVLGALAPLALWARRARWSPAATIGLAVLAVNWFFYAQRGPYQGAGFDLRYFTMSVPALVLFAAMGLAWAVRDGRKALAAGAATYFLAAVSLVAVLVAMAHKNFLLDWTDEAVQTYVVMRVLGVTTYAMILVAALGRPWLGRFQQPVLGAFLGLGLLNSHLWVFTTQVIFHSGIRAHDGYPAFNHVLPLTHWLHELAVRWLIPPKWGVA